MRLGRWSIVIVIVCLVACERPMFLLPGKGGPRWLEIRSEHFTLWTNTSTELGHEIVRLMEYRNQVIMAAMNYRSTSRAFLIGLRDASDVHVYTGEGFGGIFYFDKQDIVGEPLLLFHADPGDLVRIANHEVTHLISHGFIRQQPRWFAEGMAGYFETAELDSTGTSVLLGRPPASARFLRQTVRPAADLFGCKEACVDSGFYAASWALFAFLVNEHSNQLREYIQCLNNIPERLPNEVLSGRYAEAWRQAFPDLPREQLDDELLRWLRHGTLRRSRIPLITHDYPRKQRPLRDADVLAAHGLLAFLREEVVEARRDADAALAKDPTNVLARLITAELTHSLTPGEARATAAAHPDDWRAWRLVERAFHGSPEGDAALARLCALAAHAEPACARPDP